MSPSVLIVDDDPQLRRLLRLLIERDGRCTVCAEGADGRAALDLVEVHDPDLLLLDLEMPVMDGFEVLAALRDRVRPRVVVLTGAAHRRREALGLGAAEVVAKGRHPPRLLDLLAATTDVSPGR